MNGMELWKELMQRITKSVAGIEAWMSAKPGRCTCCGNMIRSRKVRLPLCIKCYEVIPWITKVICPRCGRPEACPDCPRREMTRFVSHRSAVRYNDAMKSWLGMYKYRGDESMRKVLGPMLLHAYHLHKQSRRGELPGTTPASTAKREVITFVPLSRERLLERGFNQAAQLAQELGELTRLQVVPLLLRTRHTGKQSFKARTQRLADLKGAFTMDTEGLDRLRKISREAPARLYIVDDVYTTGSTLNECARTIKEQIDVEVCGISWAR